MNVDTNDLYDLNDLEALREDTDDRMLAQLEKIREDAASKADTTLFLIDSGEGQAADMASVALEVERIPDSLHPAARQVLKGKPTVKVARRSGGKLSRWAAGKRRNR